eukprot:3098138-Pyramimonas_sp.AAC.1
MILGLQETHGTLAELRDFLFHLHMPVEAFASFLEHGENAAGGVVTFLPSFSSTHSEERRPSVSAGTLVQGRVLNVRVLFPGGVQVSHCNIHNHGLTVLERNWVIDKISEDLDTASQDPMK